MAASTLLSNPNLHRASSRQLIQSANRNTVESNMRHNETRNNSKSKKPMKGKKRRTDIDTSDPLIENADVARNAIRLMQWGKPSNDDSETI